MFNYLTASGDVRVGKIIVHAVLTIIVLIGIFGSFGTIGAGERGVKTRFGAVVGMVPQGLYVKTPFIEAVHVMDVKTQSLTADDKTPLLAASNDLQDTRLSVVVNYHINPNQVVDIYQQYGSADTYYMSVVDPLIVATIKSIASQYTAADQIQKRGEMSDKALVALTAAFEGKNVVIEKADITNIAFSDSFSQAIEAKVTAVQNADAAKNKLVQVQAEADQTVAKAKAEAEAIKIQAQAINSQGGADYVELQRIQKWNGVGCSSYCGMAASTGLLVNAK
jgi:regulator of protease activity HflC (stomatin/prohibitin superfamily)